MFVINRYGSLIYPRVSNEKLQLFGQLYGIITIAKLFGPNVSGDFAIDDKVLVRELAGVKLVMLDFSLDRMNKFQQAYLDFVCKDPFYTGELISVDGKFDQAVKEIIALKKFKNLNDMI